MLKSTFALVAVVLALALTATAQKTFPITSKSFDFCNQHPKDLYCFLPSFGLQGTGVTIQGGDVNNINQLMATELSLLRISSPASGITFSLNPQLGLITASTESLGPILSDRADTLGKNRIFLGFSYQHIGFDSFEGHPLSSADGSATITGIGNLTFVQSINKLSADQFTFFLGYGLMRRIDLSVAVPIRSVSMGASGNAIGLDFVPVPGFPGIFVAALALHPNQKQTTTRSGLSDVTFRVKGEVLKRERGGVALGLDIRTPTGKPLEFLGAGATGVKPFVAASFSRKVGRVYLAPHLNFGYEFNGRSILGGTLLGEEGRLPRQFLYAAGTEVGIWKRATISLDFVGAKIFGGRRTYDFVPAFQPTQVTVTTGNVNIEEASAGVKVNVIRNLVVTGNLAFKVNNGGLRARLIPLVGVSYTF